MAVASFRESLQVGQLGESAIAQWLRRRGWHVLPAYEKEIDNGKGPRLFMAEGDDASELITPDLLAMRSGLFLWIEAKHKTVFSWYGTGHCWNTGVDKRHFDDYVQVQQRTAIPVWLLFLHRESTPWAGDRERWPDCPDECPTGLFGGRIDVLEKSGRFDPRWGPSGMIYWQPIAHLHLIATLAEVFPQVEIDASALFF